MPQIVFYGLPWLTWNARPAVLFDLALVRPGDDPHARPDACAGMAACEQASRQALQFQPKYGAGTAAQVLGQ